jgi:putative Holliday junction resolvase
MAIAAWFQPAVLISATPAVAPLLARRGARGSRREVVALSLSRWWFLSEGRILGLDVGERRIGVAISDPDGSFALPLNSIDRARTPDPIDAITDLAREDDVTAIVVGMPLSLSGAAGAQAESVTEFARDLERRVGLPVHFYDERLSTQEAIRRTTDAQDHARGSRRGGRARPSSADTDALAASIILQAFLDRQRLSGGSS